MNTEIKAVHFSIGSDTREYIEKKIHRLDFAKYLIVDLLITLTEEKKGFFKAEVTINFRWNVSSHIKEEAYDLIEAIDKLMDKIEKKVRREKEKVQDHSA